jgi:hypothetical protein
MGIFRLFVKIIKTMKKKFFAKNVGVGLGLGK